MNGRRKLHIGISLAPTWLSGDAWRRPDSCIEYLHSSGFYLDVARRAEAAKLDFAFRPDTLFLNAEALETGPGFSSLDPTVLLASIARETSRIGLLTTVSTTFYPPYAVARQIQSLNWLSNGRAGWNIVTALDGSENFGLSAMPAPDERYDRAAECAEVVRLLWSSYPETALELDRESGRYADSSLVRPINHHGRHFHVKGPLNLPSCGEAPIPLFQAGASPAGRKFAAAIADGVFASTPDKEAAIELRKDLHRLAAGFGRKPRDIRLLPGLSLYLARSRAEATALFRVTHVRMDKLRKLASIKEMIGLDMTDWPDGRRIMPADLPEPPTRVRSRTHADLLRRLVLRTAPTSTELMARPEVIGSAHWQVIGTVDDAMEQIADWAAAGAMDGFIALPGGSVDSMRLTLDDLVPRLSQAGLFRREYSGSRLGDHLREAG